MLRIIFQLLLGALLMFNSIGYAAEIIKIGVSLGLTGGYALTSNKQKKAYELFEDDINSGGGVLGRSVKFIILDNKSHKETAIAQYRQLIIDNKVDFVIGPYTSGLTLAIAPVVEDLGYPTLAAGAAADVIWQKGYTNIFGMWTPASRYVLGFLKLMTFHKRNRIVIVTGDGAFAKGLAIGARKWAKALRLEVLDFISFPEGTDDFIKIAERVRASNPNILICTGHYYIGASMKRALLKIGWQPQVFYATVSPTFQKYFEDFGELSEFDFSTAIWEPHPKLKYPGSYEFAQRYTKRFGEPPTYHAASAYAAGEVLKKAIEEAGTLNRDVIKKTLQNLNTMSIIGRYAVDRTGIQIKRFPLIVQWQKGKKEIVWPLELQTQKVKFKGLE